MGGKMATIKIHQFEVLDALSNYLSEKYCMNVDLRLDERIDEHPVINYFVPEYAYKKTRDGKDKLDKWGCKIIDYKKTKYHKKWIKFDDAADIEIHI